MNHQIFTWYRSRNKLRQEIRWLEFLSIFALFVAALALFCLNLGNLPLLEGEERTIAQVAKEIAAHPLDSLHWLFPTFQGKPYLTQPPLVHGAIALLYRLIDRQIWTTRLPGAFLAACSVPLLYSLGREIFIARTSAIFAALMYLTLWPVVQHGRLAALDGAVLCFEILTIWCVLRSRRDLRWALGAGIGLSLLGFSHGMMGAVVIAIALVFLAWDTPRLLSSGFFALGLGLGIAPVIAWYVTQSLHYGMPFAATMFGQYFKVSGKHSVSLSLSPLIEIFKFSWPWLIFSLYGLRLAWQERNWGWAKLILVWSGVFLVVVSLFSVQHSEAIVPIYPALALAGGAALGEVGNWPVERPYPRLWASLLSLLALVPIVIGLAIYFEVNFSWFKTVDELSFVVLGALSLTWGFGAILLAQRSEQFISILIWGMYVSWLLLVSSSNWI
ncbi:MAG: glycosyltransferase family 39 protein [Hydrococcus sp. Prado102]|nr:glycosyltransferase family 39 protein [Hydrococcus sp. Prado102]